MKLKLISIAMIVAVSVAAFASYRPQSGSSARRKRAQPSLPFPKPSKPTLPGLPPIIPTKPTLPTIPDIPIPGHETDEPGVPFPLATTLPFPWGNIEGLWRVEVQGAHLLFSFRVETDIKAKQYLRVIQIDHSTGTLLAEGVGISIENDKLVRAAMTPKAGATGAYMLFIGSYKNDEGVSIRGQTSSTVTVLTVRSFSDLLGDKDVQVPITKVSNAPYGAVQTTKSLPKPVIAY